LEGKIRTSTVIQDKNITVELAIGVNKKIEGSK
jgi:hypothetical protein